MHGLNGSEKNELRAFEYLTGQKHVNDVSSKQDDIANIIYSALDHMYCDNCRFNSEIKESDTGKEYRARRNNAGQQKTE